MKTIVKIIVSTLLFIGLNFTLSAETIPQAPQFPDLNLTTETNQTSDGNFSINPPIFPDLNFSSESNQSYDGNYTDGNYTDGNYTDGNYTDGNYTDGNYTDGNNSGIPTYTECNYNQYKSVLDGTCKDINPVPASMLGSGVWLDLVVDKTSNPPVPTGEFGACTEFAFGETSSDLNMTHIFKDFDGTLKNENISNPYYDESSGMLSFQISFGDNESGSTSANNYEYVTAYLTKETYNGNDYYFIIADEYNQATYKNEKRVDGLVENNTTIGKCNTIPTDSFTFVNDYYNPNTSKNIQISGNVYLPSDLEPYNIHLQIMRKDWGWLSDSNLDEANNNAFILGLESAEEAVIRLDFNYGNEWYEFIYNINNSKWEKFNYNNTLENYATLIDSNISGVDFNLSALFASQVKLNGTIDYESGDNIYLELIDMQTGQYFGWRDLSNGTKDFSINLPSNEIGDKFVVRVNKNSSSQYESYFIDLRDGTPKFIPDQNIEWKGFIKDNEGELQEIENNNGTWQEGQIWLPDFSKTGYFQLEDKNSDSTITQADIADLNLSFLSSALDDQFYIIEGNVTVPASFTPGEVKDSNDNWLGWNNINFEVTNKETGAWVKWQEIERTAIETTTDTKTFKYKIKLDSNGSYIVRVNYEYFDQDTKTSTFNGYYVGETTGIISDRKIEQKPVLEGLTSYPTYTMNKCFNEGKFWYESAKQTATTTTTGLCYDQPMNWKADSEKTGYFTLTDLDKKKTKNIDFVSLSNDAYRLVGEIVVPDGFSPERDWNNYRNIRVEAINADTGAWLGNGEISEFEVVGKPNTYKYSFVLNDVNSSTKVIVKLVKEENSATQNNWESYYIKFNDETNTSNVSFVSEESVKFIEKEVEGQTWSVWIPDANQTGYLDLSKLTDTKTINININYDEELGDFENNKLSIKGTITLTESVTLGQTSNYFWNEVRVEAISKSTGEWITSNEAKCASGNSCTDLAFELEFPNTGEYIIKINKNINGIWEEYYYNFGADRAYGGDTDKIIDGQKVEWNEAESLPSWGGNYKNWMPNPEKTGWVNLTTKIDPMSIDFSSLESSIQILSGTINVPFDFVIGEICSNGTDQGKCEWNGGISGYNQWVGSKNLRVEAIRQDTGEYVASTDVREKVEVDGTEYRFKLKLGSSDEVGTKFIVQIRKEENSNNSWKSDEIFYNFGTNNTYEGSTTDTEEKLVNAKKVQWIESNVTSQYGHKMWMPDSSKSGWIDYTSVGANSVSNFAIDLTQFGSNSYKISGKVTLPSGFTIGEEGYFADVSAIDSSSGLWVGNSPISSDGSYQIDLGEESGKFILQVNYSYNDYSNWQNSWWKNKFYDFGSDNIYGTSDDSLLTDNEVKWVPILGTKYESIIKDYKCFGQNKFWYYEGDDTTKGCYDQPTNWIPNINGVNTDSAVSYKISNVNIDLTAKIGNTLRVEITNLPTGAKNPYIFVTNPTSQTGGVWKNLEKNVSTIEEIKDGNYTVEFGFEDSQNRFRHYFLKGTNSSVEGNEVRWQDLGNNMWGPNPEDTTYLYLTTDTNLTIALPTIVLNEVNITLSGLETNKNVDVNFRSLDKPYGRFDQVDTASATSINKVYDDVKNGEYILSFWYDYNEYTYDAAGSGSIKKNAEWVAYSNGAKVCPKANNDWNCDWTNSQNWIWRPDVTLLNVNANTTINVAIPASKKITATIDLGSELANKRVDFNVWQQNGGDYAWQGVELNSTGGGVVSINIEGGNDYRIEFWAEGLGGYVYDTNKSGTGNSGWINSQNSWADNGSGYWGPKASTLVDISGNLDLGTINVGSDYATVVVTIANLDKDGSNIIEEVWLSLESDSNGYYGEGNAKWENVPVTYDENITLKVPTGTYKLLVFPYNHKGGYASNGDSTADEVLTSFTKLSWNNADAITVSTGANNITVTLPTANQVGTISGTVTCGTSDCSGWIDAWNSTEGGKGAAVDANGSYTIKGLQPASYDVTYWANSGAISLNSEAVSVSANTNTSLDLTSTGNTYSLSGSITGPTGVYAALIKTNGTEWEVVATRQLDDSGNFDFGTVAKPASGKGLYVAGGVRTSNSDGSSTVKFGGATKVDSTNSVVIPSLGDKASSESISVTLN